MYEIECECGCGNYVNYGKKYLRGHHMKGRKFSDKTRKKISEAQKGKVYSDETRKRMSEAQKGKKLSDETKKKIGDASRGREYPEEIRNKMGRKKGVKFSDEIKRKMSESHMGKKLPSFSIEHRRKIGEAQVGEKGNNWQGGKSFEPYSIEFNNRLKRIIKERDNYRCRSIYCRRNSKRLCIHHIDYDKNNCSEENLITICNSCNVRANRNREYWTEFYKSIILKVV